MTRPYVVVSAQPAPSLLGYLYTIRLNVEQRIAHGIPEPEASFLSGILLGSKRAIPENTQADLKATGTTHIIAISGANITILLEILLSLLPIIRSRTKFLATTCIGVGMALMTGCSASVLRGAVVASLTSLLRWQERKAHALGLTLLPASALLIANPLFLKADPGFQLSFTAYAGLLFFSQPLTWLLQRFPGFPRLPELIRSSFIETAAASTGTFPVSWLSFGSLSFLGLAVNPTILWLLTPITFLGLLYIGLGWWHPIALWIILPLWFLLHTVLRSIHSWALLGGAL